MTFLVGASNPGDTNAIVAALPYLQDSMVAVGEHNDQKPLFPSAQKFRASGLEVIDAAGTSPQRYDTDDFKQIIKSRGINAILTGVSTPNPRTPDYRTIDQALIAAGDSLGVPTVAIEPTWGAYMPENHCEQVSLAVLDSLAKRISKQTNPHANVHVTGNPAYDAIVSRNVAAERAELRESLGIADDSMFVMYGGQVSPDNPTSLSWIIEGLSPSDTFYFGRHPRDERQYDDLQRISASIIDEKLNFEEALPAADLCVTHYSTIGLSSVMMNIPTLFVHVPGEKILMEYVGTRYPAVEVGAALGADTKQQAVDHISAVRDGFEIQNNPYLVGGLAGPRVAALFDSFR